ncbi:hypothetical protein TorRG33x02_212090 [Trema orientale]|uniref:MADS-box transcription factor n=1 Tax=Trema orientale TaxID=63057 RepID=A0A2P5EBT7_TREOI|nr:hypothetical protein TorRG33x02_212090 [Trema orientale]
MLDQLADLQHREQTLVEANKALRRKLEESGAQIPLRVAWEGAGEHNNIPYARLPSQTDHQGFFQPLPNNSTLQIGYNSAGPNEMNVGAPAQNINGYVHGWML